MGDFPHHLFYRALYLVYVRVPFLYETDWQAVGAKEDVRPGGVSGLLKPFFYRVPKGLYIEGVVEPCPGLYVLYGIFFYLREEFV